MYKWSPQTKGKDGGRGDWRSNGWNFPKFDENFINPQILELRHTKKSQIKWHQGISQSNCSKPMIKIKPKMQPEEKDTLYTKE